jgi:hypothetical protein
VDERVHHVEHLVDALGIDHDFALSLSDIEFGSVEQTAGDEFELEFLVFLVAGAEEEILNFHVGVGEPNHDA